MTTNRKRWPLGLLAAGIGMLLALPANGQRLFFENFDSLPLGPNVEELSAGERVWTKAPPAGWTIDNTGMPGYGEPDYADRDGMREWAGWAFANVKWWPTVDNQRRSEWVRANGAAAIADPDEWDDAPHYKGFYNSFLTTPEINVAGSAANSLVLFFDSSWRPEGLDDGPPNWPGGPEDERINNQTAIITARWDGGQEIEVLRWDSKADGSFFKTDMPNDAAVVELKNPAGAQKLVLEFAMVEAANDWWWAVDNLTIGQPPLMTATIGRGTGFTARIVEAQGKTVTESSIAAKLDGQSVTVTTTRPANEIELNEIELVYDQSPRIFPPDSVHQVEVSFRASDGRSVVETASFTAPGYTSVRATPLAITATINETDYLTLDEAKGVQLQLDGTAVTPNSVTRDDLVAADGSDLPDRWQVLYRVPTPLTSGSQHTLKVTFATKTAQVVEQTLDFRAPAFATVPPALATALGTGSKSGLRWRTHQLAADRALGNSIAGAEAQLRGEYGESQHDRSGEVAGGYSEVPFVNFEQAGADAGNFSASSTVSAQAIADQFIPGIPGLAGGSDYIAAEAQAYIEFPTAGIYAMVVNSDDGFQVSTGNASNPTHLVLGKWGAGRGAADSEFYFRVETPGVYFFRLVYFEGTGGASVEWFTVDPDGSRALVNGAQAGALKAFEQRTVAEPELPASAPTLTLSRQGGVATIEFTGTLQGADQVQGPWTDVSGANSPYTVPVGTGSSKFYRAR